MKRRTFCRTVLTAGLCAAFGPSLGLVPLAAEAAPGEAVSRMRPLCGTIVTITARGVTPTQAEEAIGRAFAEMARLEKILSRFDAASALFALNDAGRLAGPPPELSAVVAASLGTHRLTSGAFDPTVGPLCDFYRDLAARYPESSAGGFDRAELAQRLALVDVAAVASTPAALCLAKPGMQLTLDGIAKGYIVDRAGETLQAHGISDFLVNAGGDILAHAAPGRAPWTIAVENPDGGAYPAVVRLSRGAVATSGPYESYMGRFDSGRRLSHLLDPRTGISPQSALSATVTAASVMEADALATALCVLSPREGVRLVDSLPGRECFLIATDGGRLSSRGFDAMRA